MNVFLINTLPDGGIAHYTHSLFQALSKKDLKVSLITTYSYEFENEKTETTVFNIFFRLAFQILKIFPFLAKEYGISNIIRRIIKIIEYPINVIEIIILAKKKNVKIMHIQSVNEIELLMVILLKAFGFKIVFTIHNVLPRHGELTGFHKWIYKILYRLCNHLIIHTESGKEQVNELFNIERKKMSVIPHGNYEFLVPEKNMSKALAKTNLGFTEETPTLLFFGAIRPNKGLDRLIHTLPKIVEKHKHLKCMIVGEPFDDYYKYQELIKKFNLENFIFEKLGYISNEELPQYFFAADLVVLPYHEVTGSGVLQIAYAFGKPVIASDLPGFREVIDESKNGYLVNVQDSSLLAEKISYLTTDKELLKSMGAHSKYLADSKYSWDSIAQRTTEVYSALTDISSESVLSTTNQSN